MMIELVHDYFQPLLAGVGRNVLRVVAYPINPGEKVFVFYLVTSLMIAAAAYRHLSRRGSHPSGTSISLRQFLFPDSVWRTSSAWLDVRYFFFHQIVRVFLYGSLVVMVTGWTFQATAALLGGAPILDARAALETAWHVELGYALISAAALDFVAYVLHYCQHRIPLLWEFHKVHHSATVMHPLTNYREHPVDNIIYAAGLGACTGLVAAIASALLGYMPTQPTVLGVGIFAFGFNALGYHLRHSHIWLRWPGPLVYLFGSPAHHQVHHSYHPAHVNKNFAFMFPVWDLLFRTFHVPPTNADVKFGLSDHQEEEFRSCIDLYWVPFRNAASSFLQWERKPTRPMVAERLFNTGPYPQGLQAAPEARDVQAGTSLRAHQ